jgi:hypothetical protein
MTGIVAEPAGTPDPGADPDYVGSTVNADEDRLTRGTANIGPGRCVEESAIAIPEMGIPIHRALASDYAS